MILRLSHADTLVAHTTQVCVVGVLQSGPEDSSMLKYDMPVLGQSKPFDLWETNLQTAHSPS